MEIPEKDEGDDEGDQGEAEPEDEGGGEVPRLQAGVVQLTRSLAQPLYSPAPVDTDVHYGLQST